MVRTSKKVKYKKEQEELVNKLLEILPLEDNGFTLYEMDNEKDRQDKILALTEDIKKYFVYRNIGVIKNKHNSKRIWLPLCRCVLRKSFCKLILYNFYNIYYNINSRNQFLYLITGFNLITTTNL